MFETQQENWSRHDSSTPRVSLDDYRSVFEEIYRNQYFTNHGPLAKKFESTLEEFLGVGDVVTVGNTSLALLVALAGLELEENLIVPAFHGALPAKIASWLNLSVVFCDVCSHTHQPRMPHIEAANEGNPSCVVLVETWGNRCDQRLLTQLASRGWKVVVVAFESLGAPANGQLLFDDPNVVTVYSFGPGSVLSTFYGGAIATADEQLAHRCRNIRSSYGAPEKADVQATCNGRFSEFQAGLGLKSMSYLSDAIQHNQEIVSSYDEILGHTIFRNRFEFEKLGGSSDCCYPIHIAHRLQARCESLLHDLNIRRCEPLSDSLRPNECATSRSLSSEVFLMPVASCKSRADARELALRLLSRCNDGLKAG